MRRIAILVFAILLSAVSFAQTAEEIVSRMYSLLDSHDQSGLFLVLDIKIPILGTFTTDTWKVGDRIYSEAKVGNKRVVTYTDGESVWTYESDKNVIEIRSIAESDKKEDDTNLLDNITEGYDLSIKSETPSEWHIQCKKSKTNKSKDDPKTMDLVVSKNSCHPLSVSARMNGITVIMRDFSFDVDQSRVSFDVSRFPEAKIEDKR
ncbi:MAG: hypothetical protein J6Z27_02095 [Bacteroidales bacterium]|nr:hypothetical protein [Bacteroidales bacterium]